MLKGNHKEEITPDEQIFDIRKSRPRRLCRAPSRDFIRRGKESVGSFNIEDSLSSGEAEPNKKTTSHQEDPNKWKIIQNGLVNELSARKDVKNLEEVPKITPKNFTTAKVSDTSSPPTPPWFSEWKTKKRIGRSNTFAFSSENSRNYSELFDKRIVTKPAGVDKTRNKTVNTNSDHQQSHEHHKAESTNEKPKDFVKPAAAIEECIQKSSDTTCEAINLTCKGNVILTEAPGSYEKQTEEPIINCISKDGTDTHHLETTKEVENSVEVSNCNSESLFEHEISSNDKHTAKQSHSNKLKVKVATALGSSNSGDVQATLLILVEAVQAINENVAALRKSVEQISKAIQKIEAARLIAPELQLLHK